MPTLTVGSDPSVEPSGNPMAMTSAPTRTSSESPTAIGVKVLAGVYADIGQVQGGMPLCDCCPGTRSPTTIRTLTCVLPSTTCLLVTTSPLSLTMNPVPEPVPVTM